MELESPLGSDHNTSTQETSLDTETSGGSLMRKLYMYIVSKYLHTKYFTNFKRKMLTVQWRNTADISFTKGLTSNRTKQHHGPPAMIY